ncbi:ankyrin repeat domain-containing protein, chloroplastic-like [Triticum dicoccoides]|uniref:ankyrin repeat domain-containing protein, chloroplastic-like n=1 Tax=Triticum dicoccoides TaxID=85692 RepID=UPI00188EAD00|nr:ankyrin repeat domain-containing protein, chloroplastic-like [Triticum dicoccoides]
MPPPSLPLLLPFSSPILHPLPTSASRLRTPGRSLSLSRCPRPLASPPPSFAVAAVNDDEHDYDDDVVLGDCLVFEDEAFEAPDLDLGLGRPSSHPSRKPPAARGGGSLVPERWKDAVEEINLTKKEKRRIAHGLRFGSRLDRRVPSAVAAPDEYRAYREGRLDAELGHGARDYLVSPLESRSRAYSEVRLDAEPGRVASNHVEPLEEMSLAPEKVEAPPPPPPGTRAAPRNPRTAMDSVSLEDIAELFNSSQYVPGETEDGKSARSRRKLFTDEEKVLLNRRLPDLEGAASSKWLPLHTLAASGDFYLLDNLLKHKVDVNALDKDGLPAIHKAIISKKHAIINYLLRNSANPSVCDRDGATLMHYAVQTACNQTIKTLLLYNVDINRPDDYGWTPLHLAVQTQRTDIVRLLLLKGANRTLKNQDGLTPLDLCLRLGHDVRTYELIKLLKNFRISKQHNSF